MPVYDVAPDLTVITQRYACTSFPEYRDARCSQWFHCGIDLGAANAWDRPQYATRAGRVTHAGPAAVPGQPGLGTSLVIRTDDGVDMIYGHFARLAVSVGQRVAPRQVVGYTGSTGYSTGPHAHIEVRRPGSLVGSTAGVIDPGPYLNASAPPEPPKPPPLQLYSGGDGTMQILATPTGRVDLFTLGTDGRIWWQSGQGTAAAMASNGTPIGGEGRGGTRGFTATYWSDYSHVDLVLVTANDGWQQLAQINLQRRSVSWGKPREAPAMVPVVRIPGETEVR